MRMKGVSLVRRNRATSLTTASCVCELIARRPEMMLPLRDDPAAERPALNLGVSSSGPGGPAAATAGLPLRRGLERDAFCRLSATCERVLSHRRRPVVGRENCITIDALDSTESSRRDLAFFSGGGRNTVTGLFPFSGGVAAITTSSESSSRGLKYSSSSIIISD